VDFHSVEARRDPYPLYREARASRPVQYNPQTDFWMVFHYDGVRRLLSDPDVFSSDLAAVDNLCGPAAPH
jgi:cytochrome P450